MSLQNYQQAKQIMLQHNDIAFFIGPRPEGLIDLAEKKFGLKFTDSYRDFLKSFGAGNFGSEEIFGVINDDFENSSVPDAIWYTLTERKEINLPQNLLIIYDTGSDELYCLDFNRLNDQNEPAVVSFVPGIDLGDQKYNIVANDFGDFLLNLINQVIESQ